jgi:nucleotide-binding universal stress UspA family protein
MTNIITRILVPIDFSAHSERALDHAAALAKTFGASVELLHVVEDPFAHGGWGSEMYIPDITQTRQAAIEDAERQIEATRTAIADRRVPIVTSVRMGRPAPTIIEHADAVNANLIVMGTHGRTGVARMLIGSVAEQVVRTAHCPVLTVRPLASGDAARAVA